MSCACTVNPEIFVRILFLRIALKDIFVMLEITYISKRLVILAFCEDFIFTKYAKFRENKTLSKISEFTVYLLLQG